MKRLYYLIIIFLISLVFPSDIDSAYFKYFSNPILNTGILGTWDSHSVWDSSILIENNIFRMWFTGYDGNKMQIGYSESFDPVYFTKNLNNPIINWDIIEQNVFGVGGPSVLKVGGVYKMWFVKASSNLQAFYIYYSQSADGISWSTPMLISFDLNSTPWDSLSTQLAIPYVRFNNNLNVLRIS